MNIKDVINTELGVYDEVAELKTLQREIKWFQDKRNAKISELYTVYVSGNDKAEAYRKAKEGTDYYFEMRLGKELYEEMKRIEKYIQERMTLLNRLL